MLYLVTFISRSFYVKAILRWSIKRAAGYKMKQCFFFVVVVVVVFYARNSVIPELAFKWRCNWIECLYGQLQTPHNSGLNAHF